MQSEEEMVANLEQQCAQLASFVNTRGSDDVPVLEDTAAVVARTPPPSPMPRGLTGGHASQVRAYVFSFFFFFFFFSFFLFFLSAVLPRPAPAPAPAPQDGPDLLSGLQRAGSIDDIESLKATPPPSPTPRERAPLLLGSTDDDDGNHRQAPQAGAGAGGWASGATEAAAQPPQLPPITRYVCAGRWRWPPPGMAAAAAAVAAAPPRSARDTICCLDATCASSSARPGGRQCDRLPAAPPPAHPQPVYTSTSTIAVSVLAPLTSFARPRVPVSVQPRTAAAAAAGSAWRPLGPGCAQP
eukprot:COSAG01_NODE_580_length_15231_cov_6.793220_18_plen_298_part_00